MSEDLNRIMKCLTLSVEENEIKNLQSLSWAINKLENFSMTFDMLDQSRIGQTLQSVRHSKKISVDLSERIRYLIKCWRKLLDANCLSVIPNEIRKGLTLEKPPPEINGIKNGYIKENINNINGIKYPSKLDVENPKTDENLQSNTDLKEIVTSNCNTNESIDQLKNGIISDKIIEKIEESSVNKEKEINEKQVEMEIIQENHLVSQESENNQSIDENPNSNNQINQENICNSDENSNNNNNINNNNHETKTISRTVQIGKPKLKSTKELLADFSNLIDTNTKNKILMDKITQEDDDPTSYQTDPYKLREIVERNTFQEILEPEQEEEESPPSEKISKLSELDKEIDEIIAMKRETKCDKLLKKFQELCGIIQQPKVIFQPMIPWRNLKRGIDCSSPTIKQPKRPPAKRTINPDGSISIGEPENKRYSITDIDELLQTFELRSQRKDMITAAIMKRKETQIVDNTQSITDLSLKLKLKIPQQKIQILKLKKRKKKKKKKPKPKPKPVIKKPRKPRIKPKPPITNYLEDLPKLSEITEKDFIENEDLLGNREKFENSEENLFKFTYGFVEGYNCTKHTQTTELLDFTAMYSVLIDKTYLHVFPWVDLEYPAKSTFSLESDEIIKSALDLPQMFS